MKKHIGTIIIALIASGTAAAVWLNREIDNTNPLVVHRNDTSGIPITKSIDSEIIQKDSLQILEAGSYKNLEVFIIYKQAEIVDRNYVTLDDAMKLKLVVVQESEIVNELRLNNRSDEYIYIHSGDIVKGGKQDRTIMNDIIIPPKTSNNKLACFCVEHDRWSERDGDNVYYFGSSSNILSDKKLKVAAKVNRDQSEVWEKVNEYQDSATNRITNNYTDVGAYSSKSSLSSSSLELTLNNKEIKKITEEYSSQIKKGIKNFENANGIAIYINGKLNSIDMFNNSKLFHDMFDKLLNAYIAEAIACDYNKKYIPHQASNVRDVLKHTPIVKRNESINRVTRFTTAYLEKDRHTLYFITEDRNLNKWLHKNWLNSKD